MVWGLNIVPALAKYEVVVTTYVGYDYPYYRILESACLGRACFYVAAEKLNICIENRCIVTRRVFLEKQRTLTLPMHLVTWSTLLVFSGVRIAHLLLLLSVYYFSYFIFFVCLFSMSGLCPWITFF